MNLRGKFTPNPVLKEAVSLGELKSLNRKIRHQKRQSFASDNYNSNVEVHEGDGQNHEPLVAFLQFSSEV